MDTTTTNQSPEPVDDQRLRIGDEAWRRAVEALPELAASAAEQPTDDDLRELSRRVWLEEKAHMKEHYA